jgi:hypothetical protein
MSAVNRRQVFYRNLLDHRLREVNIEEKLSEWFIWTK